MKKTIGICAIAMTLLNTSCEKMMVNEILDNTPESNFQEMWGKFDSHYGLFLVKNIDWHEQYVTYLPQAKNAHSDEELYVVLTNMLSVLNDKHVTLYTTDLSLPDFNVVFNGPIPAQEDFHFPVIKDNYLTSYQRLSDEVEFGTIEGNIGYVHLSSFKDELADYNGYFNKILGDLENAKAIILDIRDHTGGSDHISKYVAGRFTTEKRLFMTSKKRNGPNHDDFERPYSWFVETEGGNQFTKPVILLTTSRTISAGETFTLAMRENSNVIHIG